MAINIINKIFNLVEPRLRVQGGLVKYLNFHRRLGQIRKLDAETD